jgi:uncharacterized protein (DUF302 family)
MSETGLITLPSTHDVATTLQRLLAALAAKGITVFAQVDHAAGAASAGMVLRPTTVVIFGNPVAGTPLMQAAQTTGIDLPLKILVWQDAQNAVQVSYNDPAWIATRHGLASGTVPAVAALSGALEGLARHAAGA